MLCVSVVKRSLLLFLLLAACQSSTTPSPVEHPAETAPPAAQSSVYVTASTLNVRRDPSANAEVVAQVKRGEKLTVIASTQGWTNVRLANDVVGWVSTQHISANVPRSRKGCLPDSDFRFASTPTPDLRPTDKHGLVVIDATVDVSGKVVSTKVVSNGTGDADLAQQAEREIRSARFVAPVRDCAPRTFIFTYKRTF
jgi:uncharacterized protein YgiM (DUF1202 family)